MKKLIMIIMLLLPTFAVAQTDIQGDTIPEEINMNFVDDLEKSMLELDFVHIEKHLADTVGMHIESTDRVTWHSPLGISAFFNKILAATIPYSYTIDVIMAEGLVIYKLSYFVLLENEDGSPKLGVAIFAFSQRNGVIDVVLAP